MLKRFTGLFLLFPFLVQAQVFTVGDFRAATPPPSKNLSETSVRIGRQFLGKPYVAHTLDRNASEQLVVNFNAFDCTTYLETVLALSFATYEIAEKQKPILFEQSFRHYLTRLRYRNGQINGYGSRLHYFSEWLRDNERNGLVADVTASLQGSMLVVKPISYMTTATDNYPRLTDPAIFKQVAQIEALLSQQPFSFIPKKNIALAEPQIQEGDIIMLMAARPGLDMKHVGIAVKHTDGRIHLMHASSEQKAVVISSETLSNYVLGHKKMSGIRVARLRPNSLDDRAIVQSK